MMGKYLDLSDVAHGHTVSEKELSDLRVELTAMSERAEKAEADVKVARGQFEGACIIIGQLAKRIREFEENNGN